MRDAELPKPEALKLHTKTTIVVSVVLMIVFSVIAYFSNLAATKLSDRQEREEAELLATQVANTVEHHAKRVLRTQKTQSAGIEEEFAPDWSEVKRTIEESLLSEHSDISQISIFQRTKEGGWQETVRLLEGSPAVTDEGERGMGDGREEAVVVSDRREGNQKFVKAVAPIIFAPDERHSFKVGRASISLVFDERQSYAAKLRRLVWPLILLAIGAITLCVYVLFRQLIYKPIDQLLLAISKAESGDLAATVSVSAPDEIGLLTQRFNRMLARIRDMTAQLADEQRSLEKRVQQATAEIAERNQELEEANLRLFDLQRQQSQLERQAAAGQLAAQFAHEVGTPLNLISGHIQLLRARATDDKSSKRLEVISAQIERITGIVRTMLDATRRPRLRLAETNLAALIDAVLEATLPILTARNIEVKVVRQDAMLPLLVDAEKLQQVMINLINNSIDAMPQGGALTIRTETEPEALLLCVADTGEGIREEDIGSIFEPMFSTKSDRGTGLGLTIVKQIIVEHGGSISVESRWREGTTFSIRLPLQPPAPSAVEIESPVTRA